MGRSAPVSSAPKGSAVHGVNHAGSRIGVRSRGRRRRIPATTSAIPAAPSGGCSDQDQGDGDDGRRIECVQRRERGDRTEQARSHRDALPAGMPSAAMRSSICASVGAGSMPAMTFAARPSPTSRTACARRASPSSRAISAPTGGPLRAPPPPHHRRRTGRHGAPMRAPGTGARRHPRARRSGARLSRHLPGLRQHASPHRPR